MEKKLFKGVLNNTQSTSISIFSTFSKKLEKENQLKKKDLHSQLTSSNSERSREPKSRNLVKSELSNKIGCETKMFDRLDDLNKINRDKEELKLIIKQLLISQEQKNDLIKKYSLEIMSLNASLREKENEILIKDEIISRLKNKINEIKQKTNLNKNQCENTNYCLTSNNDNLNKFSNKLHKPPPILPLDKHISEKSLIKIDTSFHKEKNYMKDKEKKQKSSNQTKSPTIRKIFYSNTYKLFKDNNATIPLPNDFYDRLTYFHQSNKDNLSMLSMVNGNLSILKYDFDSVLRVFNSPQMTKMEDILENYESLKFDKKNLDRYFQKIDEMSISLKSIINDFRNNLICFPKINYLLSAQSLFCEKILLDDIFIRFSTIFNNLIDSENSHLFIYDRVTEELCTLINKTENYIRFKVSDKELLGQVLRKKSGLVIDNVLNDKRYDAQADNKFNYFNIRSIYLYPIVNSDNEVIAIIEAFNKKNKYFDQTDEIFVDYLAKLLQIQIQQSIEYSDLSVYINKMKKFLDSIHYLFLEENQLSIIKYSLNVLKSILLSVKSQIIFLSSSDNKFYKYNEEDLPTEVYLTHGIIGLVYKRKLELFVEDTTKNKLYNNNIDLITSSSLITKPIFDLHSKEILAIIQCEYTNTNDKIDINVFQNKEIKYLDNEILSLFCNCLSKALTINRKK